MEIEVSGLGFGLFSIAIGLAFMGYFIGKGLQNFNHPEKISRYHTFLEQDDLEFYLNLNEDEIKELLKKHPDIPKIVLNDVTYYPKKQFMDWLSSNAMYKS